MGLIGSIGGDGVVVSLMWFCGIDSDAEDACAVSFPDWLRVLRVLSAIFGNRDEGMLDLFVEGDCRPDETQGCLQTIFLLFLMKLCDFLNYRYNLIAHSLCAYEDDPATAV